jgi:hypothetical protein
MAAGLDQAELGAALKVSRQTVSGWENGAPISENNREALERLLPDIADTVSGGASHVRERSGAYDVTALPLRPQDVDGVLLAVEAMSRTIGDLVHAARLARETTAEDAAAADRESAVKRAVAADASSRARAQPGKPATSAPVRRRAAGAG